MADPCRISISPVHEQASCWFERASAATLGVLPCRRGCSSCCFGPFPITVLDADLLRQGLASLHPGARKDIQDGARRQIAVFEEAYPRLARSPFVDDWSDSELDAVTARFRQLPCPALAPDGGCQIYAFRPVTCRTMGIPPESDGLVQGACGVQTSVPVVRLPQVLREDDNDLAMHEAAALVARTVPWGVGEEILMPYGLVTDLTPGQVESDEI